jgi:hypothetical protein
MRVAQSHECETSLPSVLYVILFERPHFLTIYLTVKVGTFYLTLESVLTTLLHGWRLHLRVRSFVYGLSSRKLFV